MKKFRIAVYPGDGIGPEVTTQAVRVLRAVQARQNDVVARTDRVSLGRRATSARRAAWCRRTYLEVLRPFDAILLGALGWPAEVPDHISLAPLITLRQRFDQYACMRPAQTVARRASVLADKGPADIDMVVIRENSEGEYVDNGGRIRRGTPDEFAVQTAIHTRKGIERILRFGFEIARTRSRRMTMITKSNALKHGYVLVGRRAR